MRTSAAVIAMNFNGHTMVPRGDRGTSRFASCVVRGACALLLVIAGGCGDSGGSSPTTPTATTPLPAMSVMLAEKALGSAAAPVTMIDYSSLGCSHCADFHAATLPQLKSAYIDTGRMRFVYRDYPLDNTAALAASMVARCSGDNYFAALDALFKAQASWAYSTNYTAAIKAVVSPLGITAADVDACLASTELRNGVVAMRDVGRTTYGIQGTPTFIINGQTVVGAQPYAVFAAIIDSF
jgi:protein-disulfide isomerase